MHSICDLTGRLASLEASLPRALGTSAEAPIGPPTAPQVGEEVPPVWRGEDIDVLESPVGRSWFPTRRGALSTGKEPSSSSDGAPTPCVDSALVFANSMWKSSFESLGRGVDCDASLIATSDGDFIAELLSQWTIDSSVKHGVDDWLANVQRAQSTVDSWKSLQFGHIERHDNMCTELAQRLSSDNIDISSHGNTLGPSPAGSDLSSWLEDYFLPDTHRSDGNIEFIDPFAADRARLRRIAGYESLRDDTSIPHFPSWLSKRQVDNEDHYFDDDDDDDNLERFKIFAGMGVEALIAHVPHQFVDGPESNSYWYPTQPHKPSWYQYPWCTYFCTCYWCKTCGAVKAEHEVHDWCWCQHCKFKRSEE